MKVVSIAQLESAINAARSAEPADGTASTLSEDVALLAGIYGELIYLNHRAFDCDSLTPDQQRVLTKWLDNVPSEQEQARRQA